MSLLCWSFHLPENYFKWLLSKCSDTAVGFLETFRSVNFLLWRFQSWRCLKAEWAGHRGIERIEDNRICKIWGSQKVKMIHWYVHLTWLAGRDLKWSSRSSSCLHTGQQQSFLPTWRLGLLLSMLQEFLKVDLIFIFKQIYSSTLLLVLLLTIKFDS